MFQVSFLHKFLFVLLVACLSFSSNAQSGFINRQATTNVGRNILDPNSDGFTSATTSGFLNDDVNNSELIYKPIKAYSIEPFGDLARGPSHRYSDFVPDVNGNGVYYLIRPDPVVPANNNVLFRMRLGSIMSGSKGYSILMDTDGKFGATGPNADPNYLPQTNGTNGNPGFEIEIVLETNFRIAIYNVDGSSSATLVTQYLNWQEMSQISIAGSNDNGDPDFFIDFYIPFSALMAAPFNLTTSSPIRMSATTVMSPQAAIGGPRSDIYGVSGSSYDDFISGQPSCTIFNTAVSCITAMCTAAPTVNSPISPGTVNITGTWTKSALTGAASPATITVYKNGTSIGTVTNVASGAAWSLNSVVLVNGDVITAKAQASGETMCLVSNAVTVSSCNTSNTTATSNAAITCITTRGMSGTRTTNEVIKIYTITATGGPVLFATDGSPTSPSGYNISYPTSTTWAYEGQNSQNNDPCGGGAPDVTAGSYFITVKNSSLCESAPIWGSCVGNGTVTATPVITQTVLYSGSNISGTAVSGSTVFLYINGVLRSSQTATGGNYSFTSVTLNLNDEVQVLAQVTGAGNCISAAVNRTVTCFTNTPLINVDVNNQLTAGSVISGTSTDPAGTIIRVYNTTGPTLLASPVVQSNGTWSTTNPNFAVSGSSYYANAQNGSCGVSGNSATFLAPPPTTGRCGSITGPITKGATSVSGTVTGSVASTTVNLYLDGELIGTTTTGGTGWTISSIPATTIYSNGVLTIGVRESGKQELACPLSATTVTCTPTPVAPIYTVSSSSVNQNSTVTYTISNAISGSYYAISDTTGQSLGQGAFATGSTLVLTTDPLTTVKTYRTVVRGTTISGLDVCSSTSAKQSIAVSSVALPLTLLEFKGAKQLENIKLEWVTEDEVNVNRFEIERSRNGSEFYKISQVLSSISNSSKNDYSYIDNNPVGEKLFYRLKIIDNDGKFKYSKVLAFNTKNESIFSLQLNPNPFFEELSIRFSLEKQQVATIRLVDLNGRQRISKIVQGVKGENLFIWKDLSVLESGIYFVQISTDDTVLHHKVFKSK